jgi:hypothetical protein
MIHTILLETLHSLVNVFAAGRSGVKLAAFISFIGVYALWKVVFRSKEIVLIDRYGSRVQNIFIPVVLFGFVCGIFGTILLYVRLGLSFTKTIVVMANDSLSTTHIFHTHVMKAGLGLLVSFLKPHSLNADTGIAFMPFMPGYFAWLSLFVDASLIFLGGVVAYTLWRKYSQSVVLQLLSTILVFSVVKNVIDGGLLNYEAIPAIVVLWIMIYGQSWKKAIVPLALISIWSVSVFCAILGNALDLQAGLKYAESASCLVALYIGVLSLCLGLLPKRLAILVLIVGSIGCAYPVVRNYLDTVDYLQTGLKGQTIDVVTYAGSLKNSRTLDAIGNVSVFESVVEQDKRVADVLSETGDIAAYYPVAIQYGSCFPLSHNVDRTIDLLTQDDPIIAADTHTSMTITSMKELAGDGDYNRYQMVFSAAPCTPRPINLIQELLKEHGVKQSVLYFDLYDYGD